MASEQTITIKEVRDKIKWHLEEAQKLQSALDILVSAFGDDFVRPVKTPVALSVGKSNTKTTFSDFKVNAPVTFKSTIIDLFNKEKRPVTAKEMLELYETKTKKKLVYSNFSGQFSILGTRDKVLKKITLIDNPIETRYYYGLTEWFDGDELKEDYAQKIKAGQVQLY